MISSVEFQNVKWPDLKQAFVDLTETMPEMPSSALSEECGHLFGASSTSSTEVRNGLLMEVNPRRQGYLQKLLEFESEKMIEELAGLTNKFALALSSPVTFLVNGLPLQGSPTLDVSEAVLAYFNSGGTIVDNVGDLRYEINEDQWGPRKVALGVALARYRGETVHAKFSYNYQDLELDFEPDETHQSGVSKMTEAYNACF